MPFLWAATKIAVSVGSPICCSLPSSPKVTEPSQHRAPYCSSFRAAWLFWEDTASSAGSPSTQTLVRVIRFWVRVPVLSEQITEALPNVSTAGRRRMRAFFFTIRWTPMASTMVTIAGRPSGMADTARETEVIKISSTGMPLNSPTAKITAQAAKAKKPRYFPSWASFCCRGVWVSASPSSRPAILPISVRIPVPVTTAVAVP